MGPGLLFLTLLCLLYQVEKSYQLGSLEMVIAIFRHGDRTREKLVYPKDPHINETFDPVGIGGLTNEGKLKEYNLGGFLRSRYNQFLGPVYRPNDIKAFSSDYSRTKNSLQLVLAGLYPPQNTDLEWNPYLNWNPIPFDTILPRDNRMLTLPLNFCPRYVNEVEKYFKSERVKEVESKYVDLYEYVSVNSGLNVTSVEHLGDLYDILHTEERWGLRLPEWTKVVYPDFLYSALVDYQYLVYETPLLKKLSGGFLLRHVIADMLNATKNKGPKMYLYSAHDATLSGLLSAMNVNFPHVPPYGACIMLELHNVGNIYFVRILYLDYSSQYLKVLTVPSCNRECPIEKFKELLKSNIPEEGTDPCIL
ncbi:hypothetical protein FQR65_LT13030 [Abscondita terminalis]|nr:hypothetical protein FQR65_LT13030 [Abscondita terminalis]